MGTSTFNEVNGELLGMTFDQAITLGSAVLQAIGLLVGLVIAFTRLGGRIDLLAQRLKAVEDAINSHRDGLTRLSILEERVTNHGKMIAINQGVIEDLRKGRGFIQGHRGVDGEYSS